MKIRLEYTVGRPINEVFDALTDHANYERFAGFTDSQLLEAGHDEPDGVGALRVLVAGRMTFKERITRFERPTRMDYRIEELKPLPLRHDRGEITLTPVDEKTNVVWISEGQLKIPSSDRSCRDRSHDAPSEHSSASSSRSSTNSLRPRPSPPHRVQWSGSGCPIFIRARPSIWAPGLPRFPSSRASNG